MPPRRRREPRGTTAGPRLASLPPRMASGPFLLLALLAALYCGTGMVQAVDTWISLAGGRHIASHGVGDADPFSFNSRPAAAASLPDGASAWERVRARWHPTGWVNQNWLTHVILFRLVHHFGEDSLVAMRLAVYLVVASLLFLACRAHGAGTVAASLAVAAAMVAMRPFAEFRAQELTNVLAAAQLVVLALAAHRSPRYSWATPPLLALWANVHGGFVYGLLAGAVAGGAALAGRRAAAAPAAARHALAALAASLAAAVLASPYRLANLTHPIEITIGAEAALWRRVNEWLPAVAPGARIGEVVPYFVLLAATALLVAAVLIGARAPGGARAVERPPVVAFELGAVLLALVTALMALRSMRFVPLSALTLAPLLAVALDGAAVRLTAARGKAAAIIARASRLGPWAAAAAAAVALAYLGFRYERSYLRPWPFTARPVSQLARMTWAHRYHGLWEFLRGSGVGGRTFNVWEEGGMLLWGGEPAPSLSLPALQVFIDGRAQAAYPAAAVRDYLELAAGGPAGAAAIGQGREPGRAELAAIADWVDRRLERNGIWLVVVPEERSRELAFRALYARPSWRVVFLDPFHAVLADRDDERGRALDAGVENDVAAFPDEATRLLTLAYRLAERDDHVSRRAALDAAVRSYTLRPTAAAAGMALRVSGDGDLHGAVVEFARTVVAEYRRDREACHRTAGALERLRAIGDLAGFLAAEAGRAGAASDAEELGALARDARTARASLLRSVSWWG